MHRSLESVMNNASAVPHRVAAVIGASIAGLLAARVLSERFDEVWLFERDTLPAGAEPRKGTPQAVQPHGLLARGREVIESLFPGFTQALVERGAITGDLGLEVGFDADRHRLAAGPVGHLGLAASRLAIEAELRARVLALPGLRRVDGVDVLEPVHEAGRVRGLRYMHADGSTHTLDAELVVDCSGRGSRSPGWLRRWGYEAPVEERVQIGLCYASAYFRRDGGRRPDLAALICTATPGLPRPGVFIAQEPDSQGQARWVVGVGGYAGDHPQATLEGLRERARHLGDAELLAITERAEPIGPVLRYQFPHSQRRRYERLARFPRGYLVMGDAITSFNPIYGQGMTVAACEALALRRALARSHEPLARRFFAAAAKLIDVPWQLAVGGDLALPGVPGPRPLPVRLVNAYVARLYRAARHDAVVAASFLKVVHLVAPPAALFHPGVLWRVMRRGGADPVRPAARGLSASAEAVR
jgi:2-polyprenyl-6-methoxyphenol hydroxylase-like FAD-dependent oxidoreductase